MIEKRALAPRIHPDCADLLVRHHPNLNAAAVYHLEAQPHLHLAALAEIRGRFTAEEARLIRDAMAPVELIGSAAGRQVLNALIDHIRAKRTRAKIDVSLIEKLRALTSFQRASLELWAKRRLDGDDEDVYDYPTDEEHLAEIVKGISAFLDAEHDISLVADKVE